MRRAFIVLVVVFAVAIALTIGPRSTTATDPADGPTAQGNATTADYELIAAERGWSEDQLAAHVAADAAIDHVAVTVAERSPEIFVGSAHASDPLKPPTLFIKGRAPDWVKDLVSSMPVQINVHDLQPFSFAELEDRSHDVNTLTQGLGYKTVSTYFEPSGAGLIEIEVIQDPGLPIDAGSVAALLPSEFTDAVHVTVIPGPAPSPDAAFGGMGLNVFGRGIGCSTGFVVDWSQGRKLGGAGHCGIGWDLVNHPGHGTHSVCCGAYTEGPYGDFMYMHTEVNMPDDFYADTDVVRDVADVVPRAAIQIGDPVCGFGGASRVRRCGVDVTALSVDCGGGLQRLVRMSGDVLIGGDSGGPWFKNQTAYGIHRGACGASGLDHWSVAELFPQALGPHVATN